MTEKMFISDLPPETIDAVCDRIAMSTVALNRVFERDGQQDIELIGTGTLVNIYGLDCILTAHHVLAVLKVSDKLSLMTSFAGRPSGHQFTQSHLGIHRIAKGADDETGPDIGLIVLPQTQIGALRSEKVFFNLSSRAERFAGTYPPRDLGFWFNCGLVGETEQNFGPRHGQANFRGYEGLCGASANPQEFDDGEFDYLEVRIDYGHGKTDVPGSFGGMSGGGLWQVPMSMIAAGGVEPDDFIFSGVAFFQTEVQEGKRRLRCHGRKTVYEYVPEYVLREIKHGSASTP